MYRTFFHPDFTRRQSLKMIRNTYKNKQKKLTFKQCFGSESGSRGPNNYSTQSGSATLNPESVRYFSNFAEFEITVLQTLMRQKSIHSNMKVKLNSES